MFVFDTMLGKVGYYGALPDTTDELVLVPFEDDVTVLDDDLRAALTLDEVTALLTESTAGRITATSAAYASGVASLVNPGWIAPTAGPEVTRVLVCYVPASGDPDTSIVPMVSLDVSFTPDGVEDFPIDMTEGYFQASGFLYV